MMYDDDVLKNSPDLMAVAIHAAMESQWRIFIKSTKEKADVHGRIARFWSYVDTTFGLGLIVMSALAAVTASWSDVPSGVVTGIACIGTVLASMNSFLKPAKKQSIHHTFSRNLQLLRIQMICCETEKNYKKLWSDFNKQISEEPLIFPKTFANAVDQNSTEIERQPEMSMELLKELNMNSPNETELPPDDSNHNNLKPNENGTSFSEVEL